ncbi:glutamate--tRNA ligase [Sphingomonas changbaiensis NBRC 104936]|uniref:Glutamate--tRNA ligase n=2 Tax=Sphingomonas changbaiensis TaxID=529705 RepID=A0A0E9MS82_9SPHN|nr:glutamate--tRNA ligase [Sphingomonas changbaiensis NBRC 104936]
MSAVLSHDFARARGGRFLLRIEDIDPGRAREEHIAGIEGDLRWLGLDWDGPVVRQSQRLALYAEALERLKLRGLVYPCFCTRADIARSASAPHGPDGPLYPGTCRDLRAPDLDRPHAWRLDVAKAIALTGPLSWRDERVGTVAARPELLGDVVLARKDAPVSYHLAVTVDDAAQGVTDVIRGEDLFLSTHVHRLLQDLLQLPTPAYHHHRLLIGPDGERLAKRHGALALADLRADGVDPQAIVAAFRAGTAPLGFRLSKD